MHHRLNIFWWILEFLKFLRDNYSPSSSFIIFYFSSCNQLWRRFKSFSGDSFEYRLMIWRIRPKHSGTELKMWWCTDDNVYLYTILLPEISLIWTMYCHGQYNAKLMIVHAQEISTVGDSVILYALLFWKNVTWRNIE